MIWTLSWQIEGKTFHAMHQAVHSSNKFSHFIFSTKIIVTFIHSSLRVVRIAPPSRFAPPKLDCFKDGSRQIGTRQIGPRQIGPLVSNPANWAPHFRGPNLPFPWKIGPRQIAAPTFSRGPICRSPICQGPICRGLICRVPICLGPNLPWPNMPRPDLPAKITRGPIWLETSKVSPLIFRNIISNAKSAI